MATVKHTSSDQILTRCILGEVHLLVTKETWAGDVDIPQYAVEDGADITDHISKKGKELTLVGYLMWDRKHAIKEKLNRLERHRDTGTILTYSGGDHAGNFLIHRISHEKETKLGNAWAITIVLKQQRFAKRAVVPTIDSAKNKTNTGKKQVAGSGDEKYHVIKKGDTYTKIAKQYGVDWQQIKKWAGYPDKALPIGKKVRVQ